jgi:hypothetical protein
MHTGQISHPYLVDDAETIFCGKEVDWFQMDKSTLGLVKDHEAFEAPFFTHMLYTDGKESRYLTLSMLILELILDDIREYTLEDLTQVRVNLMTKHVEAEGRYTQPHKDDNTDIVVLYYVNDSDGPTRIFKDGAAIEIEPKKGHYVMFDNEMHAASFPAQHDTRVVINYNIKIEKRDWSKPPPGLILTPISEEEARLEADELAKGVSCNPEN